MSTNNEDILLETAEIKKRYLRRKQSPPSKRLKLFWQNVHNERFKIYKKILTPFLVQKANSLVLEIGATSATNVNSFVELGINKKNILLNNLLDHYFRNDMSSKKWNTVENIVKTANKHRNWGRQCN